MHDESMSNLCMGQERKGQRMKDIWGSGFGIWEVDFCGIVIC